MDNLLVTDLMEKGILKLLSEILLAVIQNSIFYTSLFVKKGSR